MRSNLAPSSRRRPGPIPTVACDVEGAEALSQLLRAVVMGPGLRRDDGGVCRERLKSVIARLDRATQYSRVLAGERRPYNKAVWNTGSPAFAGDDGPSDH